MASTRKSVSSVLSAAAFLAAALLVLSKPVHAEKIPNVIYGDDDRVDLFQVKDKRVLKLADSAVALFEAGGVELSADGQRALLSTQNYGQSGSLCKDEPFYDQPVGAFCSGSLVAPDLIMTAGHCVPSAEACPGIKFVFGFNVKKKGAYPKDVAASDVYGCKELVGRLQENEGADWALVRIDRPASGHTPLAVNRGGIENGTPVFVVGHPAGLPVKVSGGAKVRDASKDGYFVANLDTYGGNSGSAVFNAKSGLVEGILVRGEQDYTWRGSCRVSNRCKNNECRGEDVTKVSALSSLIPTAASYMGASLSRESFFGAIDSANAAPAQLGRLAGAAELKAPEAPRAQ